MNSTFNTIKNLINSQDGPWGPYNDKNDSKNKKPNNGQKDFLSEDDFFKKIDVFFKKFFDKNSGNKSPNNIFNKQEKTPKSLVGIVALIIIGLWLISGLYKVNPDENAVVLYFGKVRSIATPGLNYHIPFPIGKIVKKSVTTVNTEQFGSGVAIGNLKPSQQRNQSYSLMLTGDENIVDIDFQVQWQISDIKDFTLNVADPNTAIRKAAESAMREVIAKRPIADALSDGKGVIEQEAKFLLQEILDSYKVGVRINIVQLLRVNPPAQVIDAFLDVQNAKADREKEINQSQAYSNDIVPRARGEAAKLIQESEAYKSEVVSNAEGQANRFISVYNQYLKAKDVTKKRIYLETIEKIYQDIDKIIIDKNISKSGVVPYLPLNDLTKKAAVNKDKE